MSILDTEVLFGNAPSPYALEGLVVQMRKACEKCGSGTLRIGPGKNESQPASLRCNVCNRHSGYLSLESAKFVCEVVTHFGRPTAPLVVTVRQ
jgi:hypothetical protein